MAKEKMNVQRVLQIICKTELTAVGYKKCYSLKLDGQYVSDSLTFCEKEIQKYFEFVSKNLDKHNTEEVIEERIINQEQNKPF
jgi:hypothetical protein